MVDQTHILQKFLGTCNQVLVLDLDIQIAHGAVFMVYLLRSVELFLALVASNE
jgi:hypothetical protein